MGTKLVRYSFTPKENEQVDAVITLSEDPRSVIHGVVRDEKGNFIKDAVVKLFMAKEGDDPCEINPVTHTFTDECGQFLFGPLMPGKRYVVKVWAGDSHCREEDFPESIRQPEPENPPKNALPQKSRLTAREREYPEGYYIK